MLQRLSDFHPIKGDDLPTFSMKLRDLPDGYHITDIVINQNLCPKTYAMKDSLLEIAERYYRNFEVNGETLQDFKENIQLSYDLNALNFETVLDMYPSLKMMVGSNTLETFNHTDDRSKMSQKSDVSNESSSGSGSNETLRNRNTNENTNGNVIELHNIESENSSSTVNSSKTDKISNSDTDENVTLNESESTVDNENETTNGTRTNQKTDTGLQSETQNEDVEQTTDTDRNLSRDGATERSTTENRNAEHLEIAVSLDSNNLHPHSKTVDDQSNQNSEFVSEGISEDENIDVDARTKTERNRSLNSESDSTESETVRNDIGKSKIGSVSKDSVTGKSVSVDGTETISLDENGNVIDVGKEKDNVERKENAIRSGNEIESEKITDSSSRNKDVVASGNEKTEESGSVNETRAKTIDRVGNEQPVDIFDDFIKKYPNILKIFISYFADDFVIYESGWC